MQIFQVYNFYKNFIEKNIWDICIMQFTQNHALLDYIIEMSIKSEISYKLFLQEHMDY